MSPNFPQQKLLKSDLLMGMFVIAIAAMLLVPLPTFLLDLLLVANISFSLLLLLVGLYMPNALALLAFPSLLLLTTLFRLGLNVASTRLILSMGTAGDIIEAFGTFLISGEIVVGVMIFLIITIVNFIVIARGSSRVSEVAARFALDALPGKQMAIDSDLRSNLITPGEAEKRRENLRKESQLYGSMDGAMKFVQGDAIAGFFIIFTNILGGLYLGISSGLTFSDAIETYSTLTIGDGLVSQIPALLISICAGIVVTRVSSEENSTLGTDVASQLLRRPANLFLAGFVLLAMGLLPGLPFLPFFMISAIFFFGSWFFSRTTSQEEKSQLLTLSSSKQLFLPHNSQGKINGEPNTHDSKFELYLDGRILYPLYERTREESQQSWQKLQIELWKQRGIKVPDIHYRSMRGSEASFKLANGTFEYCRGTLPPDALYVEMNPNHADAFGFEVIKKERHPCSASLAFWTPDTKYVRSMLQEADICYKSAMEYIALQFSLSLLRNPSTVLKLNEVHARLKEIETLYPGMLADSLPLDFFTTARISQIMHRYVEEGGSIRSTTDLIEALSVYASTIGANLIRENDFDLNDIISFLRLHSSSHLVNKFANELGVIRVCSLSQKVLELFEDTALDPTTNMPVFSREVRTKLIGGLESAFEQTELRGVMPVAILCSQDIRSVVSSFLRALSKPYSAITVAEMGPMIDFEKVYEWSY